MSAIGEDSFTGTSTDFLLCSYSVRLPSFLRSRSEAEKAFVFLADAQIGTGAAAFMAIRVLLDHGVPQERIVFVTLLASAKGGVHALARAFPKVRIVVAGIAPGLRRMRIPYKQERRDTSEAPPLELPPSQRPATSSITQDRSNSVSATKTRVCYAILPSPGHPSARYWRDVK